MATVKVNKNIDFLVDEHGNLVGARNPKSQTSADPNYADTALATVKTNPVTGGIVINANSTFVPQTNDYDGIMAAVSAAVAQGGGVVKLEASDYLIGGNTLPLISGVSYVGSGVVMYSLSGAPDISATIASGTRIIGNGTNILMAGNTAPGAIFSGSTINGSAIMTVTAITADPDGNFGTIGVGDLAYPAVDTGSIVTDSFILAQLTGTPGGVGTYQLNKNQTVSGSFTLNASWKSTQYLSGFTVENIGFINAAKGIVCGAFNAVGPCWATFKNLYSFGITGRSWDILNCEHIQVSALYSFVGDSITQHGPRFAMHASPRLGGLFNSLIDKVYHQGSGQYYARGIDLGSTHNTQGHGSGTAFYKHIQHNGYGRDTAVSAVFTFTNGSASISVPDSTKWPVGMPVRFTASNYGFSGGGSVTANDVNNAASKAINAYFVVSSAANTIKLAVNTRGTEIVASGTGTLTGYHRGFPHISILGGMTSGTGFSIDGIDIEGPGAMLLVENSAGNFRGDFMGNTEGESVVARRGATLSISGSSTVDLDTAGNNGTVSFFGTSVRRDLVVTGGGDTVTGIYRENISGGNRTVLNLTGNRGSDQRPSFINKVPGNGDFVQPGIALGVKQAYGGTQSFNSGSGMAGFAVYTGVGGTFTFGQGRSTEMQGFRQVFKNGGTGALTVTLGGSDGTFDGMTGGSSAGKSMLLAAATATAPGGSLVIVLCQVTGSMHVQSGSTWVWMIESMVNATLV